jgi:methionyl-tRNA synthetase
VAQKFRDLLPAVNIANDDFIRMTEPRHHAASQELWRRVRIVIIHKDSTKVSHRR